MAAKNQSMNPLRYLALGLAVALAGGIPSANAHNPSGGHTTATAVSCTPNPVVVNTATTCTATVTDVIGSGQDAVPSGTVNFSSSGAGSFSATTCTLAPAAGFSASCAVTYTPSVSGTQTITASYPLTNAPSHRFAASSGTTSLTVRLTAPGVAKAFSPNSIATGATSTLTITLSNSNTTAITGAAFTDTYPANLVNASAPAGSTTCTGGTVIAAASGGSVALSGATIPASGSCTVTVSVTSSLAGSYPNTIAAGAVTSTNAGSNTAAASATLTVLARPVVAKAFSPNSIATGATSTLTITLSNSNATAITGAAFTDSYPANLVNASTPAGSTNCAGGTVTAAASGGSVALSGATIPASGSCTVTVSVTSSLAGSYPNTIAAGAVTSTNAGSNTAAASATLTVTVSVASFDAVEVGGAPGSRLFTKLGGVNFTLDILALDSSNLVSAGYSGTVSLVLVDASTGGGVCASMTALQALGSLTFAGADAGRKITPSINYAGAARNTKIRINDAVRGITSCSFDAFAIRPATFSVTSNMTNSASSGTPILAAGGNFTLTATALAGYNGTPAIDNTKIAAHSGANQTGSLSGVFSAAVPATGIASGSTFTYSEVGNFQFLAQGVYDDTFTAVDQPGDCTSDFSNALAGGKYGCKFGAAATSFFGRFTPFDFAVTRNTPLFAPACASNFTYVGQPFNYANAPVITVTARNSAGTTTRNYVGAFMKIANGSITPNSTTARYTRFDALGAGTTPALDVSALPLAAVDPAIGTFTDGVGALTFSGGATGAVFTRSQPVLPFNADIALSVSVADTDGVLVARIDGAAAVNPVSFGAATAGNGIGFAGAANQQRFGRLALGNAFGSELLDLPIPIEAQYYNSSGVYVTNTGDNCTAIALNNVYLSSGAATTGGTFASGKGSLKLTKPLVKTTVDLCVDLDGAIPTDATCVATAGNKTYLQWKWSGSTYDKDPVARATFGVFKSADEFIYLRENY